ncbi:MAG: signal peptide peptidase SppA [Pseudomonadales bacterium]|jgi:protease-4|nr:signal peptide peptidase SppA [Pseudomonadales bacterium]MDP7359527.1 signal peptide peptidase SppA [Pseudomonadales bacterium]MDP7594946.1 signal peptide peptidase SppA [Pseudomonadales bacterium]HJN51264.1 signal peptide peptidase SppA [Pseudomonadales bacterium]|tara:strand:- start:2510 stop:4327 length:1818 start_codon:yes stop_codon:yes gene_type:complete
MGKILKVIWQSITVAKQIVGNLLFLTLVVVLLIVALTGKDEGVPDSAALILNPSGILVEQKTAIDPINQLLSGYSNQENETLVKDVLDAIEQGKEDARIKLMVLDLQSLQGAALSNLQEIGKALTAFKESGKEIYTFAASYDQSQYYLAAHADHLYLSRLSFGAFGVLLQGFGSYPTFYKSALDKLKIQIHTFKVGTYKSFVEPFTRDSMSDEAKQANSELLGILWDEYRDDVTGLRSITAESFDRYNNQYDLLLREAANDVTQLVLTQGLVDELKSRQEWIDELTELVGKQGSGFSSIGFRSYLADVRPPLLLPNPASDKVAVIVAKGIILDGDQPQGTIGGESTAKLIRQARNDDTVKAVVMRVDTGGGSAFAAEMIRYELATTQQAGKPVVVSMGGVAASGGYWISAGADRILAANTTITGSIGIFGLLPTFEQSLDELGIHSDGVGTTAFSGAMDPFRPLHPMLQRTMQQSIEYGYRKFINIVADGRNMTPDAVDAIAQGRVWSGKTALELGLVDQIGDLKEAIQVSAELAGLDEFEVIYLQKPLTAREQIISQMLQSSLNIIGERTGSAVSIPMLDDIRQLARMNDPHGLYLQCLTCLVF